MSALFGKILIANRGEIACRVIRTARSMGIDTVAVFSDADRDALHVALADEAVHIGPPPPAESYLAGERIIAAARKTGAQAIHPGYGFLAENAAFAAACRAAGLVFIGPPTAAIEKMGKKDEAKRLMTRAGVPVVPGYHGSAQSAERLAREAGRIGFPVLIKAAAGGGGKGMRRVDAADDFAAALKACRREAKAAFGDDRVLIEKLIEVPRHIEVQIFADAHGHVVHLFERDCSLQRRHQKVVEEAPAPGIAADMREKMGAAAVAAARAVGYEGAGTVEFIVDVAEGLEDAPFYFMEMNTRLQVEHPVTEMITGEDLVEWQIRVAAGAPLPLAQTDLAIDGHAIEVRLYAEDPERDFLPATGALTRFRPPLDDPHARTDTGVREGDAIGVHYDPMIAKIIVWGADRDSALAHLRRALARTEITGLATNLAFLQRLARHPAFADGAIDTGFLARHRAALVPEAEPAAAHVLALATLGILAARRERESRAGADDGAPPSPWRTGGGWRLNLPYSESQSFIDATDAHRTVAITGCGDGYHLAIDGNGMIARIDRYEDGRLRVEIDGHVENATVLVGREELCVIHGGESVRLRRLSARFDPEEDAAGPGAVTAPMPGKVLDLLVTEGAEVERGTPLLVLEAMKMEHTLTAPRAGTVASLAATVGAQVEEGALLVEIAES